jgi:putative oxidoreductase
MTPFLQLVGRILISAIFIWAGWGKLMAMAGTIAYMEKSGLPMPTAAYWVAVLMELGVGLALFFGLFTRLSGAALAFWCIVTALVAHTNFADHNMEVHFMKNVAMCGGLLYVAAFGGGAYSLDALLFRRSAAVRAVA